MKVSNLLSQHGVKNEIVNLNGIPHIMADNEDGTFKKFEYYTPTSLVLEYLGY